ncbi:MAG: 4'-phosphopantetheinyl transferase superfamily protein, partial [Clostridia bacterium]|nr:4'-phosphopantetheinyl transferase superfamily protein [Clostridia bacterium]
GRIEKKAERDDRLRSVAGEMLVRRAVAEEYGVREEDILLLEDERGAPYIKGIDVHVSISHAGDYAVCAVADAPVGIDIEKIKPTNRRIAERTFSKRELEYLGCEGEMGDDALLRFFEIWTAKEAYAKMQGTGLSLHDTPDTQALDNVTREYIDGYVISVIEEHP